MSALYRLSAQYKYLLQKKGLSLLSSLTKKNMGSNKSKAVSTELTPKRS